MAGDWIKMRGNLWDDPRVSSLVDATNSSEAAVIGGLYWLWATADQHTENGVMPGLTLRQIDRKTGIPGLGAALVEIGWLSEQDDGVVLENFTEHNGASAKRRASDAKRKANERNLSASDADNERKSDGQARTDGGAREREEEEKEKTSSSLRSEDVAPTTAGEACKAMRAAGLQDANPQHPKLAALLAAGISVAELVDAAKVAVDKQKPFVYALSTAEGRRRDSAIAPLPNKTTGRHAGFQTLNYREGVTADGSLV